jgi:hypothetical protein
MKITLSQRQISSVCSAVSLDSSGDSMRKLCIVLLSVAVSATAFADGPRWCSVSSRDPSNTVHYAPIAMAAQVQGGASAVIVYKPNGLVEKVESVSGPLMLSQPLANQLSKWVVRSNAPGDEYCQALVVATFKVGKPTPEPTKFRRLRLALMRKKEKIKFTTEPNTIRISVSHPGPLFSESSSSTARQGF